MDQRLVAWARAVKSRRRLNGAFAGRAVLWLFTDAGRLANPMPAAAALPRGLGGVVLRHDGVPGRAALGRALARLCRARRLALSVAGTISAWGVGHYGETNVAALSNSIVTAIVTLASLVLSTIKLFQSGPGDPTPPASGN